MYNLISHLHDQLGIWYTLLVILGIWALGFLIYHLVFRILRSRFIATYTKAPPLMRRYIYYPGLNFFALLGLSLFFPLIKIYREDYNLPEAQVHQAFEILLIISVTVLIRRTLIVIREVILSYYGSDALDDLENRKVVTQLKVIERIVAFLLIIAAISFILMTFKTIREVGYSLLVSAGVIGIILGFAAQKSIANVVAGIQLAFAQPIRLNDVVIIENEWGKIEEITLTYVVVKIWDERRLVVPLNQFIEKPFQNWTRNSSELLGTVFIYADYTLPLDELRQELKRLLNQHEYWDSRVVNLQVTDARESTIQIRALMSARNAGEAFDLRCDIREGLIRFIQKNYPESLPKYRVDWTDPEKRKSS